MESKNKKSPLERFLGAFADVNPGEGITVVLLTFNVFLVLTAYYIAKVVREPFILAGGGAELKSYLAAGQVILLLGAVRLYAGLANKVNRSRLINLVNIFFSVCLVVFYFLAQMQVPGLGIMFFLWVGMFNVMVVAQFWSFANDVYTPEMGKRLFAIVAFGASGGAVLGSYLPRILIDVVGLNQMLLVAAGVLLLSLVITNYIDLLDKKIPVQSGASQPEPAVRSETSNSGAFKLVFQKKYLLMIAFLILILNWVNTNGEYILGRMVKETAEVLITNGENIDVKAYIGKFYADFFTAVNILGVVIQLFLVSRILKYFGIRVAILALPCIAFIGNFFLFAVPVLSIVRWAKTFENATDYSLNNTVRHALFLPTTREEKYKAKQAIDSFFHRSGDVLSALVVFIGFEFLSLSTKYFALFNLLLVAVWLYLAFKIGKENSLLTNEDSISKQ